MKTYRVTWEIDIDAKSPKEAAKKALTIHRNGESIAVVFKVSPWEQRGQFVGVRGASKEIDLQEAAQ